MTGICAGVRRTTEPGDLAVATQCFAHATGPLIDGNLIPLQNRVSIQPWLLDFLILLTDSPSTLEQIRAGYGKPLPDQMATNVHGGGMACGPQVIKDKIYSEQLRSKEYFVVGLDMESYGVALAASMGSTHSHTIVPLILKV